MIGVVVGKQSRPHPFGGRSLAPPRPRQTPQMLPMGVLIVRAVMRGRWAALPPSFFGAA